MSNKLRFGIVGLGRISKKHISAIQQCEEAVLTAVCDVSEENVYRIQAEFPDVKTYVQFDEFLKDPDIDCVTLCTPSGMHAAMAIQVAESGKHCLTEKPMAMNSADCLAMIEAFHHNQKIIAVSLQNRFNLPIQHVVKLKESLGRLLYSSAVCFWYRDNAYYEGWHGKRSMDGGVLMNQGNHYVDMLLYISGKRVKKVSAFGAVLGHDIESEDVITANLQYDDGSSANIQLNTISYPQDFEGSITLCFEKATIKVGGVALNQILYWKGVGEETIDESVNETITDVYGNHHSTIIHNLTRHALYGDPLQVSGEEGMKSIILSEQIYKSIQKGGEVITL